MARCEDVFVWKIREGILLFETNNKNINSGVRCLYCLKIC